MTPLPTWFPKRAALVLSSALAAGACDGSPPAEGDPDDLASIASPLYRTGALWPNGEVRTCWAAASMAAQFATQREQVQNQAENSWARVARIRFVGWQQCPANPQGVVRITIDTSGTGHAGMIGFPGANGVADMTLGTGRADFATGLIPHEFGHTLGFAHEFARNDFMDDPAGSCRAAAGGGKIGGGDTLGTPPDRGSIMVATGYCHNNANLGIWDVIGAQRAYGRKHSGALVGLGGRCVNIPNASTTNGTALQVFDCHAASNDTWRRNLDGQLIDQLATKTVAMNVPNGMVSATSGTILTIWDVVAGSVNEKFDFNGVKLVSYGNLCVGVPSATQGARLQLVDCNANAALSRWDWERIKAAPDSAFANRFKLSGTNLCINIPNGVPALSQYVQLFPCGSLSSPHANELFGSNANAQLSTFASPRMCLNVANDTPTAGAAIVTFSCGSSAPFRNEQFHLSGKVKWAGNSGQCLNIAGGTSRNGTPLQVFPCTAGAANEEWEYYF